MAPNLQEQMLIRGDVDISALFTATSYMNLVAIKQDPDKDFRWIYYSDGRARSLLQRRHGVAEARQEKPEAVKGLVRAINKAMKDCIANPDAAIDLLASKEPLINKDIEKRASSMWRRR
jgi:NitT/TauT family transport system substrate-binding protein